MVVTFNFSAEELASIITALKSEKRFLEKDKQPDETGKEFIKALSTSIRKFEKVLDIEEGEIK